jgi:hypothetical protein
VRSWLGKSSDDLFCEGDVPGAAGRGLGGSDIVRDASQDHFGAPQCLGVPCHGYGAAGKVCGA